MPKLSYLFAVACYLAIPVVVIAGVALYTVIDPEMARGHANYVRDYHLLDLVRRGVLMGAAGLALLLWIACCYLVLASRRRSLFWLSLAAAGPFGFVVIAALKDRSPATDDLYQQFIGKLKIYWRVAMEILLFVSVWVVAYQFVVVKRDLMIQYESLTTGRPIDAIVAEQSASSGMWAAGEGMQIAYLVILMYLLWPVVFNLAGQLVQARPSAT